ncbi:hypothetical protein NC653_031926 [Populus alba x Populus x berolinensis]|uniref:Uncharacterized protein n=1 Tax=Populus alba x Populus x berolinensis TaxID=444605 RepID=A0AAD6M004_9ROSI|nr:hypothetical protein NC653_031926 [Populus alba x Populus x berolinensis]
MSRPARAMPQRTPSPHITQATPCMPRNGVWSP